MARFKLDRVTLTAYFSFVVSIGLLGLSIAEVILEEKVKRVFRSSLRVQYPNSSLAEWLWVPVHPRKLDSGPAGGMLVVGCLGIITAMSGLGSVIALWFGLKKSLTRRWEITTSVLSLIHTGTSLSVLTYVFVTEAGMRIPDLIQQWSNYNFTQEFYLCSAFPSLIENPNRIYGFSACNYAEAARYNLIGISTMALLLAGLSLTQTLKSGVFGRWGKPTNDVENGSRVPVSHQKHKKKRPIPEEARVVAAPRISTPQACLERNRLS